MNDQVNAEDAVIGAESSAPAKKKLDPGFRRNIMIIGGVGLVAVVAVVLMLGGGGQKQSQNMGQSSVQVASSGRVPNTELTPAMEGMLEEKERSEAESAKAKGKSYMPADPRPTVPVAPEVSEPQSVVSGYAQDAYVGPGQGDISGRNEMYQRQREGLERQMESLIAATSPGSGSIRQRVDVADKDRAAGGGAPAAPANAPPRSDEAERGTPVIRGHYIAAAVLSNKLDVPTGKSVYVSATVKAGPLAGAFLTGAATVVNEGLELRFTKMSLGGRFYTVDVTALDEQTAANALSGTVDRKLLQRWVMPVAMATVGKFFEAKSQTGTTIVNVGGGFQPPTQGVQTPAPNKEQARAAGISAGVSIAQREVERSAREPQVVSKESNSPMGLLFNAPVYEGDAK